MTQAAADIMAKAKGKPSRDDWERKPPVLQMRGSPEWKAWLEKAAAFNRVSVASYVDQAVARFARESGFADPPPER